MRLTTATRLLGCIATITVAGYASAAGIIISEVVDADLAGGNPKFVELTNTSGADFTFANGGIVLQSNAATDLDIDVDLTGVTIPAGDSYVIQSSANTGQAVFESTYGFPADLYTDAFFSNGDDRYIVVSGDDTPGAGGVATLADIIDIHGEIDVDGTGTPWEYLDSYAYRLPAVTMGNGGSFVLGEWFHGGVAALDAPDDAQRTALALAFTTPGTHNFVPEPASIAMLLATAACVGIGRRRR
jgi:hypothetical protein